MTDLGYKLNVEALIEQRCFLKEESINKINIERLDKIINANRESIITFQSMSIYEFNNFIEDFIENK